MSILSVVSRLSVSFQGKGSKDRGGNWREKETDLEVENDFSTS